MSVDVVRIEQWKVSEQTEQSKIHEAARLNAPPARVFSQCTKFKSQGAAMLQEQILVYPIPNMNIYKHNSFTINHAGGAFSSAQLRP